MSSIPQPSRETYAWTYDPSNWQGVDILQGENENLPPAMAPRAKVREYSRARINLRAGLNLALLSDHVEMVRYVEGTTFDPPQDQLPDGTVVTLESARLIYEASGNQQDEQQAEDDEPQVAIFKDYPITRPHLKYWLDYQTLEPEQQLGLLGTEIIGISDPQVAYIHQVHWGVLRSSKNGSRAVQLFNFQKPHLAEFGGLPLVKLGSVSKEDVEMMWAIELPIEIGQVKNLGTLALDGFYTAAMTKVLGIDVIHMTEPKDNGGRRGPRLPHKKSLPKFLPSRS